jgi:hypothetical protein
MTTPDIRALCSELADHLQARVSKEDQKIPAKGYYSQSQQLLDRARAALAQPESETLAEALAARPLLERVARLGDCIGQQTVAQVRQLAEQAAAWLRDHPPGQPVAIEPRGCPTPGACSCVEPTPPAPEVGEVGELVADLNEIAGILCGMEKHQWAARLSYAATLLQQLSAHAISLPQAGEVGA